MAITGFQFGGIRDGCVAYASRCHRSFVGRDVSGCAATGVVAEGFPLMNSCIRAKICVLVYIGDPSGFFLSANLVITKSTNCAHVAVGPTTSPVSFDTLPSGSIVAM